MGNFLITIDHVFQEAFIRRKHNSLEGIHVKGLSRGNEGKIRLQSPIEWFTMSITISYRERLLLIQSWTHGTLCHIINLWRVGYKHRLLLKKVSI
jgi:hypothetical protein